MIKEMMIMVKKVTFNLNLPLSDVRSDARETAQEDIGTFIVESILDRVSRSQSPVSGLGNFKKLSKKYAAFKANESSSPIANMELNGDMLDSLTFEKKRNGIEIGIFDELEAQKADNHNKFSAASKRTNVPARKFIPNKKEGETFNKKDILAGIAEILSEYSDQSKTYFLKKLN